MGNKVLVIVDMQNDFIDGALANSAAKAIVPGIVDLVKNGDFSKIICTLDTHGDDYLSTVEGKNLPYVHCVKMTDGWMLNSDIRESLAGKDVTYLEKNTFGSRELPFYFTDLDEIYFVGTCTGICVINNVALVKASYPDNKITVYEDLCACINPETHSRAIGQMKFNHINIESYK